MSRVTLFPFDSGLPLTDSMTAPKRSSMSVGATDRFSRSIRALLFSGDNNPLADRIWGGSWVRASSITSETLGKVAHPLTRITTETDRKNEKNGLMIVKAASLCLDPIEAINGRRIPELATVL